MKPTNRRSACFAILLTAIASLSTESNLLASAVPGLYLPVYGGPTFSVDEGGYFGPPSAIAVNNAGTAVASAVHVDGAFNDFGYRAVRWDGSGAPAVELDPLSVDPSGFTQTTPGAINASNAVAGYAAKFGEHGNLLNYRAVRWDGPGTSVTELDTLGPGPNDQSDSSFAYLINDSGTVAGYAAKFGSLMNSLGTRAVRWEAGGTAAVELGHIGTNAEGLTFADTQAINNAGTIVGQAAKFDATGNNVGNRAVRWESSGTAAIELGHLGVSISGATQSYASDINSSGTIVGSAQIYNEFGDNFGQRAVRWGPYQTEPTVLGHLGTSPEGTTIAYAYQINDAGTIAGFAEKYDQVGNLLGSRAVRWESGSTTATELGNLGTDTIGATFSHVEGLNNADIAVGVAEKHDEFGNSLGSRAVYWDKNGVAIDLNTLIDPNSGWMLGFAQAISDTGWIAGSGEFDPDGAGGVGAYQRHYLIHVPAAAVPEPSSLVLTCVVTAMLISFLKRRR